MTRDYYQGYAYSTGNEPMNLAIEEIRGFLRKLDHDGSNGNPSNEATSPANCLPPSHRKSDTTIENIFRTRNLGSSETTQFFFSSWLRMLMLMQTE